ncbi:hypothetical protein C0992_010618 [Termitomyces sp. T32_za158]|nr:hypothetical protein C0992_010618 [Termitomyces sp. T32_za158]
MGFLSNLVKVFPSLATRPLYLTGESYSGYYIPYIMKAYFGLENPPVNIAKVVIGDGSIASGQVFELLPALTVIQTHPQLIGYDQDVYKYFEEQAKLCHYDVNLTYPQNGTIPPVPLNLPTQRDVPFLLKSSLYRKGLMAELKKRYALKKRLSKNTSTFGFNVYDVTDATNPQINQDASVFFNDRAVRDALHAPQSKAWAEEFDFVFGNPDELNVDPSTEPMNFLTEFATNATAHGVGVVLYSGNNDALIAHRGTEVTIQNTTFGGIQGFTVKPSTPWYNDEYQFAGIIRQERNWTYVLFDNAGHLVPHDNPRNAFVFLREFVLGNNQTGLVTKTATGQTVVIGGTNSTLAQDVLPGGDEIYYGPGAKISTYVFPSATRAAWNSFIRTETALPSQTAA